MKNESKDFALLFHHFYFISFLKWMGQEGKADKKNVKNLKWGLFHLLFIFIFLYLYITQIQKKIKKEIFWRFIRMNNIRVGE